MVEGRQSGPEQQVTMFPYHLIFQSPLILTSEDNDKDNGNVNEEELEVAKVTKDLLTKTGKAEVRARLNDAAIQCLCH